MSEVREDAEEKAKRLGMDLVKPGPDEIFVDLDSLTDKRRFDECFSQFELLWKDATVRYTVSQNGNTHAYVKVPSLAPLGEHERIALQAALGSDPFREMLAIYHGRAGYKHTSVFFEVPNTPAAVEAEEIF